MERESVGEKIPFMEPTTTLQIAAKAKPFYLDCRDDDNKMHWNNNGSGGGGGDVISENGKLTWFSRLS